MAKLSPGAQQALARLYEARQRLKQVDAKLDALEEEKKDHSRRLSALLTERMQVEQLVHIADQDVKREL